MGFDSESTEAAQVKLPLSREQPRLFFRTSSWPMEILDLSKVISESPIQVKYNYNQLGLGWGVGMEGNLHRHRGISQII